MCALREMRANEEKCKNNKKINNKNSTVFLREADVPGLILLMDG